MVTVRRMRKVLYLFNSLNDADVEWLSSHGELRRVAPGTAIIREGQPADTLFIVLDGALSATVAALGDQEVERLICGAVVGEMSFVDARPPSATVRGRDVALVFAIPHTLLAVRLRTDDGFAARFYKAIAVFLSDRLRGKLDMLGNTVPSLAENVFEDDEIDPALLDGLFLAGQRFDRLLKHFVGS